MRKKHIEEELARNSEHVEALSKLTNSIANIVKDMGEQLVDMQRRMDLPQTGYCSIVGCEGRVVEQLIGKTSDGTEVRMPVYTCRAHTEQTAEAGRTIFKKLDADMIRDLFEIKKFLEGVEDG